MATTDTPSRTIQFDAALERRGLRGFPLLVAAAALLVLMIDGLDIQLLSLVAPVIIEEWGISRAAFGPALAAALIGMTLGALIGGWIGDQIGRLKALALFTLLFGLATLLAGFTQSVATMTALRIVGGIGFGAASPNAIALAGEWAPPRLRGQITSLLSIGTPAGGMLGASVVLLALPLYGWTGTFYICGVASCLLGIAIFFTLRETPSFFLARGKAAGAQAAARPVLLPDEMLAITAPAAVTGSTGGSRLFDRALLRLNLGTAVAFFFVALVAYGQLAWTTVIFTAAGLSIEAGVQAILAFNLCSMTFATIAGFAIRRFGSRSVMLTASAALVASLVGLWLVFARLQGASAAAQDATDAIMATGLCGGTAGAMIAGIYAMMAEGYPAACRGTGLGFGLTTGRAGGIALSLGGGAILDLADGRPAIFFAIMIASAAVAACGALISDRHSSPASVAIANSREVN